MLAVLTTFTVAMLATADPSPPPRHGLDALLAKPVSPGLIALLMPYIADDRAAGSVIESLSHAEAPVRAAAARVASVAELRLAGPLVRRLLESESDRSAAAEQLRAAIFLESGGDDSGLLAAARRHDLVDVLGHTLAGVRGPLALRLLDPLREAGLTKQSARDFLATATRGGQEGLNVAAAAALRTGDERMWTEILSLARQPRAVLSPGLLLAALGAQRPQLRAAVYWHLALTHAKGQATDPDIEAAIAGTPEVTSTPSANVDAVYALVVLRRAQRGTKFGGDWGERAASGTPVIPREEEEAVSRLITKAESKALSRRITNGRDEKQFQWNAKQPQERPGKVEGEEYGGLSFAGGLPAGMMRDLLAVTGCQTTGDVRALGVVEYRPDGRPRKVSVADGPASSACAEAAGPALGLTLAPPGVINAAHPTRRTVLIVPLDAAALDCADQGEPARAERMPDEDDEAASGKIEEPRKVKSVPPWYPVRAREQGRQGVVVLEAFITATGCIRSARVVRGASPDLDAVAMIAVGQWVYTPTLLRGKPVPVLMTVTVNFRLSR